MLLAGLIRPPRKAMKRTFVDTVIRSERCVVESIKENGGNTRQVRSIYH